MDVSQNYVDRVMSEAMPNAVVWTGFAIRNEKTATKNTGNENKTRPRIGGTQKRLMCTKVQSN